MNLFEMKLFRRLVKSLYQKYFTKFHLVKKRLFLLFLNRIKTDENLYVQLRSNSKHVPLPSWFVKRQRSSNKYKHARKFSPSCLKNIDNEQPSFLLIELENR